MGRSLLLWWIVGCLLVICVLVSLWAPIVIRVKFVRYGGDDEGVVSIRYLYGLIRWQRNLTELDASVMERGPLFQLRSETAGKQHGARRTEHKLTIRSILELISHWREWAEFIKKTMPVVKDLFSKGSFDGLQVHLCIGTGDVVASGVTCGATSALIHSLLGYLSYHSHVYCVPDVDVQADFQRKVFNARVQCIFKVRAGHVIRATFRFFRVWKRRPTYGTPHSGTHANSHGKYS